MEPVRYEEDVAVFRLQDVNLYGMPDLFGYENYIVSSTYEDECPFVLDWNGEQERRGALRPIHRYSRCERFASIVFQLLGERGSVPEEVLETLKYWGFDQEKEKIWNSIRFVLKQYNWARYYNRIPTILGRLGFRLCKFKYEKIQRVLDRFKRMSYKFDEIKGNLAPRAYFPNLRYVALRMMEEEGIEFNYLIPKIRTKRKLQVMNEIYGLIVCV